MLTCNIPHPMTHNYLVLLYCWCYILQQACCRVNPSDFASIYAQSYEMKWESPDPQEMLSVIRVSTTNFVFVAASMNGIIVIQGNEVVYSKAEEESIKNLFITSDGEFVFFNLNNRLCVRNFLEVSPNVFDLQLFYEELENSFNSQIIDVTFDKTESRALVTHYDGILSLYDISKRSSKIITFLHSYNTNQVLYTSKISYDSKWIVIGDFQFGFLYYRWLDDEISPQSSPIKNTLNMYLVGTSISIIETNLYITKDSRYVITLDYYEGISTYDLMELNDIHGSNTKPDTFEIIQMTPVLSKWWPTTKGQSSSMALAVSADEKYAAMGERSVAIYIVDISDVLNPKLYQKIKATSFSYSVAFSKDMNEEFLYYSNGISLQRFKKQQPNLNIDIPNLYNVHRSMNNPVGSRWRQFGSADKQGEFFFLTSYDNGFYIMDLRKSVVLMDDCVYFEAGVDSYVNAFALFGSDDQRYLAFPRLNYTMNTVIDIFDISDRTHPVLIVQIEVGEISYTSSIEVSEARNIMIFDSMYNIVLVSTSSLPNSIEIKSIFNFESGLILEVKSITISTNGDYVLILSRSSGIYMINIEDLENPIKAGFGTFLGSESLARGKYAYASYMFLADGLSGIQVIDQTAFPSFKIIKVIPIRGFAMGLALFKEDRFALVSSVDLGQISLIDLSDITTATVVSTFQFQDEDADSVSILHNDDYFYLVNYKGVRAAPLYSDAYIHTDIKLVMNSQTGSPTLQPISRDVVFQVNQIINLAFIILRPIDGITITGIYYLQYYNLIEIPYWMTYEKKDQILQMNIVKDSLGSDYSSNHPRIQNNTIVIQTKKQIATRDFIFDLTRNGVECSSDQATLILEHFKSTGILDKQAYVTSLFEYQNLFTFEIAGVPNSEKLTSLVKMALQESIMYNPIIFSVMASLSMNVTPIPSESFEKTQHYLEFIKTISEYVFLYLTIDSSLGKFVSQPYPGVISSASDRFDQIKIEGDPANINKVLTSKVSLFLYNSTDSKVSEISVRLTDNSNYEIQQSHTLDSVGFLKFLPKLAQNPEMRLNDQVQQKFFGNSVDVRTNIDLQFSPSSFLSEFGSQLVYSAKILNNGSEGDTYREIEKTFWFQFQPGQFKFSGIASFSEYKNDFCFQINATDSYSWVTDDFCLNPSGIPFIVVLNLIIQYIGPILFVIGLYKYKDRIYNITYAFDNVYKKQELRVGERFEMPTIFIGQQMVVAKEIFHQFLIHFNLVEDQLPLTVRIRNLMKTYRKRFNECVNNLCKQRNIKQEISNRIQCLRKESESVKKIPKKLSESYLDKEKRTILAHKFINDVQKLNISISNLCPTKADFEILKEDLLKESSILRVCLLNELSRNLLSQDELSHYVYSLLRLDDFSSANSKIDRLYYQKYTSVDHSISIESSQSFYQKFKKPYVQTENSVLQFKNKLPRVKINETKISLFFQYFELNPVNNEEVQVQVANQINILSSNTESKTLKNKHEDRSQTKQEHANTWINMQLIKQIVIFDALGLDPNSVSRLIPCVGESLHLNIHEITSVQAFQKSTETQKFPKLRRWLNLEYFPLASHGNRKIPEWLSLQFKKNILILEGSPGRSEIGNEFLIRFYDQRSFMVKQFIISIFNDSNESIPEVDTLEKSQPFHSPLSPQVQDQLKQKGAKNSFNTLSQNNEQPNQSIYDVPLDDSPSIHLICFSANQMSPQFNSPMNQLRKRISNQVPSIDIA